MSLSSEQSDRNGTSQNENMRFPTVRVVKEGEVKKGSRTGKSTEKFDVILGEFNIDDQVVQRGS